MQAFILETLGPSGWRRRGEMIWSRDSATQAARSLIEHKRAKSVRVLPVDVSLTATDEFPQSDETEPDYISQFRAITADPATLPHVREYITAALADFDARRAAR